MDEIRGYAFLVTMLGVISLIFLKIGIEKLKPSLNSRYIVVQIRVEQTIGIVHTWMGIVGIVTGVAIAALIVTSGVQLLYPEFKI